MSKKLARSTRIIKKKSRDFNINSKYRDYRSLVCEFNYFCLYMHHCLLLMQSRNAFAHWLVTNSLKHESHFLLDAM